MNDVLRGVALLAATATYVLAFANLMVSFAVLARKPFTWRAFLGSGAGFLWSHIVFVTIPFQGFVTWGVIEVMHRSGGDNLTWRVPTLLGLCVIMSVGYGIILRVELARLRMKDVIQP